MTKHRTDIRTTSRALRLLTGALMVFAFTLGTVACGKKGDPHPPPDRESPYPRTYPDPRTY